MKMREQETNCRRFDTHWALGNTERQNSSMNVAVCRRSSAQDFLRDADFPLLISASMSALAIMHELRIEICSKFEGGRHENR